MQVITSHDESGVFASLPDERTPNLGRGGMKLDKRLGFLRSQSPQKLGGEDGIHCDVKKNWVLCPLSAKSKGVLSLLRQARRPLRPPDLRSYTRGAAQRRRRGVGGGGVTWPAAAGQSSSLDGRKVATAAAGSRDSTVEPDSGLE